jgi:hypothetical protein
MAKKQQTIPKSLVVATSENQLNHLITNCFKCGSSNLKVVFKVDDSNIHSFLHCEDCQTCKRDATFKMNKKSSFADRGRSFSNGDYLIHVSGVVGITTGEVIYEPKNPVEKTKIILKSGHPMVDYSMKFCIASAAEQSNLYERSVV